MHVGEGTISSIGLGYQCADSSPVLGGFFGHQIAACPTVHRLKDCSLRPLYSYCARAALPRGCHRTHVGVL